MNHIPFYIVSILLISMCLFAISFSKMLLKSITEADKWKRIADTMRFTERSIKPPPPLEFRAEVRITDELFSHRGLPPGYIERGLARKIIEDLPLDNLKALFNIESISPNEQPDTLTPGWRYEKIWELKRRREHEYRAKVYIQREA